MEEAEDVLVMQAWNMLAGFENQMKYTGKRVKIRGDKTEQNTAKYVPVTGLNCPLETHTGWSRNKSVSKAGASTPLQPNPEQFLSSRIQKRKTPLLSTWETHIRLLCHSECLHDDHLSPDV